MLTSDYKNALEIVTEHKIRDENIFSLLFSDVATLRRRHNKQHDGVYSTGGGTGELPAQRASNAENIFIWWRPHG